MFTTFMLPHHTNDSMINLQLFRYNSTISFFNIILQKYPISQTNVTEKYAIYFTRKFRKLTYIYLQQLLLIHFLK